jgi:hypothetical protein
MEQASDPALLWTYKPKKRTVVEVGIWPTIAQSVQFLKSKIIEIVLCSLDAAKSFGPAFQYGLQSGVGKLRYIVQATTRTTGNSLADLA